MTLTMLVPRARLHEWLYYETGFEQLHPMPEIVDYMAQQGYQYGRDWGCVAETPYQQLKTRAYTLWFKTQETQTAFQLGWC